jgi:hypothetical protein
VEVTDVADLLDDMVISHCREAPKRRCPDDASMLHRALPHDRTSERTVRRTTIAGEETWA